MQITFFLEDKNKKKSDVTYNVIPTNPSIQVCNQTYYTIAQYLSGMYSNKLIFQ